MGFYPFNPNLDQVMQSHAGETVTVDQAFLAHFSVSAANATLASTTGIHAAVTDTGVQQTVTTGFTQPSVPRNVTATAGGTAGDIKAIQVTVNGTDYADAVIQEVLPAFTVDTAGTVTGSKAFKTITSVVIPAHDGTGATTAIGFGEKLGLPFRLAHNTVLAAYLDNAKEGTAPTVATDATNISGNTMDLNSALNGTKVDAYLMV